MGALQEPAAEAQTATFTSDGEAKFVDKRFANTKSDLLEITHDKLENILLKFYQRHLLRYVWFNPLSLVIGVVLTLTTAEFKQTALGLDGATWRAVFILALFGSSAWLIVCLVKLALCWRETSIESLINRIKNVGGGA